MKQEMCVLPVQCKRCGAEFDLCYDLQGIGRQGLGFSGTMVSERVLKESLCWECRKVVLRRIRERKKEVNEMNELLVELE